jgi:hypothetical protein
VRAIQRLVRQTHSHIDPKRLSVKTLVCAIELGATKISENGRPEAESMQCEGDRVSY